MQTPALPADVVNSLFGLAAGPDTEVPDFLSAVLSFSLAISGADLGGAIFVPDSTGERLLWSFKVIGGLPRHSSTQLLQEWSLDKTGAGDEALDHRLVRTLSAPVAAGDDRALFRESRRAVWTPVLAGERNPGRLQVEARHEQAFSRGEILALEELGRLAGRLTRRLLLREHAAQRGLDLHMVGMSPAFLELERQLSRVATDPASPVLIRGERGSGKELAAYAIHYFGARRHQPFIAVNCATFSEGLVPDALFGHARGAFTSAETTREGIFRHADGGTLFFDEVGDMPPTVQAALLRVLDAGEIRPVGSDRPSRVNVRIVAATNKDLERMMDEGTFRRDLHDRLSVFEVDVPPLRERREDLGMLGDFFFRKACAGNGRRERLRDRNICQACLKQDSRTCAAGTFHEELSGHGLPGNVRELRNLAFRLSALEDEEVRSSHLRTFLKTNDKRKEDLRLDSMVRDHIGKVLELTRGNKTQAAQVLGLPLSTLFNKMKRLDLV